MLVNAAATDKVEGALKFDLWPALLYDIEDPECLRHDFWTAMVSGEHEDLELRLGHFVGITGDALSCERGVRNSLSEEWADT